MWGRDAAPEENCGTGLRPHLRKSGLAFRGRCNGPPQGLVCPPPGWKARVHLCRQLEAARGRNGKRGEGTQYIAAAGRREAVLNNRTRPLGAPHPSLLIASRSSGRRDDLACVLFIPPREGRVASSASAEIAGWGEALGPHPDAAFQASSDLPARGRYGVNSVAALAGMTQKKREEEKEGGERKGKRK